MNIPRRHYLKIAGFNEAHFKSLQRRNQIPLMANFKEAPSLESLDADGYRPFEAVMLACADQLSNGAVTREAAKAAIEGYWTILFEMAEAYETDQSGGFWLAYVGRELYFERSPIDVSDGFKDAVKAYTDPEMVASVGPCSIVLVDAKPLLTHASQTAADIGVDKLVPVVGKA
ncbi:MAG: hypothetical protein AAF479_05620 [Pseudomonadota bacterium]